LSGASVGRASGEIAVEQFGLGDERLREFVAFPWRLYRGDPCWTPPLDADLLGSKLLGLTGLLTAEHPYHRDAEVTHFLARRNGRVVGTVSGAINRRFNEYHGCSIGFFGFFETVEDYEVAAALLDAVRAWVAGHGMSVMRGPGQYSCATHERQGVLVEGFEFPPTVELTHNPPYYGEFLERYGFAKAKDYIAYTLQVKQPELPALRRIADEARKRHHVTTRPVVLKDLKAEVGRIIDVYNDAWSKNWGFLPVTQEEADALADTLVPIVDPQLIRFAYVEGEEREVAVLGALPDPYWSLRPRWKWYGDSDYVRTARLLAQRRRIPRVRLMFFGVREPYRRLGVDAVLFDELMPYAQSKQYTECEPSMLLEDNDLVIRASAHMGGHEYKRWRLYDLAI
jgi:GNAT superfamily N-acetyltransferase